MTEVYEIRRGTHALTQRDASTPRDAVVDYLRSLGCRDGELVRLAPDGVSWRGAVYTAVPLPGSAFSRSRQRTRSSERR